MTPFSEFYEPVRVLLGDNAAMHRWADTQIDGALRLTLRSGEITGHSLAIGETVNIAPDVADPNVWLLLALKAGRKLLGPAVEQYSYRKRALSESFGGQHVLWFDLVDQIHALESGGMFGSWQDFRGFMAGLNPVGGMSQVWDALTEFKTRGPLFTVSLNAAGVTVSPTS